MTAQEQVSRLQGLLDRIKRNAAKPRGSAAQPAPEKPFDFAAPAAPPPPAPPAPPPTPPVVSAADQSIDELLAQPSPPAPDVDVAQGSFAPPPPAAPSEAPEAEPIPLVSVSTAQPEPEPTPAGAEEAFALESEVSEVRITTGMREEVEVTVAAIEAEAEPIGTEELSDDDLIEVTEATPAPSTGASDLDIDFEDEEQPPASSQRKVATSMDEALAAAADQLESDREVPIKTPPPESGPQEAPLPQPMTAPAAPDVDALLGGELDIPTREATPAGPTAEQLGQTIELEEARGPQLELAEPARTTPPVSEELEVSLPPREVVGSYDDNLLPPPEAREDLEAHRRSLEDDIPPPPESLATLPSVQPAAPPAEIIPVQAKSEPSGPEIIARPLPIGSPESFGSTREAFRPSSFAELLDASLSLDGD